MSRTTFSFDRPEHRIERIDPFRPPYVPRVTVSRDLQDDLEYIAGLVAEIVSERADGPLSMHLYNRLADNDWRNGAFEREVKNAADFIYMNLPTGRFDPQRIFPRMVEDYITLRTFYEADLERDLWNEIDRRDQGAIERGIGEFTDVIRDIDQATRDRGRDDRRDDRDRGRGRDDRDRGRREDYQPRNRGSGGGGRSYGNGQQDDDRRGGGGTRSYGNDNNDNRREEERPRDEAPRGKQPETKGTTMAAANNETQLVDADKLKWQPDLEFPYPVAWNPITHALKYHLRNGRTLPQTVKNEAINMIDYERHNVQTLFGRPPAGMPVLRDNSTQMEALQVAAMDSVKEAKDVDESGVRKYNTLAAKAVLTATSLTTGIHEAHSEMLAVVDINNPPMVYQSELEIVTPFFGTKSENAILAKWADSGSYIELREKMRNAGDSVSPALMTEVSMRMTALMNHRLYKCLSILPENIMVDDFVTDLDDLLKWLVDNRSQHFQDVFLTDQNKCIRSVIGYISTEDESSKRIHDALTDNMFSDSWGDRPKPEVTYLAHYVRLHFIDILSHDLQIQIIPKIGNVIAPSTFPALAVIARSVEESPLNLRHDLLVTSDGRILELTKAGLIKDTYLVSLFK